MNIACFKTAVLPNAILFLQIVIAMNNDAYHFVLFSTIRLLIVPPGNSSSNLFVLKQGARLNSPVLVQSLIIFPSNLHSTKADLASLFLTYIYTKELFHSPLKRRLCCT